MTAGDDPQSLTWRTSHACAPQYFQNTTSYAYAICIKRSSRFLTEKMEIFRIKRSFVNVGEKIYGYPREMIFALPPKPKAKSPPVRIFVYENMHTYIQGDPEIGLCVNKYIYSSRIISLGAA